MSFNAVVLGAGGRMGVGAVAALATNEDCHRVIVADERGDRVAHRLPKSSKIQPLQKVDLRDEESLASLLSQADVVVNAAGPFYRYGDTVLRTAIRANCHYVDICDDVSPTLRMLDLDDAARSAGVLAVVGCGMSPGVTNMTVAWAAMALDELISARMSWVVSMADGGGLAVSMHALHMCSGSAPQVHDGQLIEVPALGGYSDVEFPEPYGAVRVYDVGHPEPVTLKRTFPTLCSSWNRGAVFPSWAMDRLRAQALLGLASDELVTLPDCPATPLNSVAVALDVRHRSEHPDLPLGPAISYDRIDIHGRRNGQDVSEIYYVPDEMAHGTGTAAAVGAALVATGRTTHTAGVFPPEAAFAPPEFFAALGRAGVHAYRLDSQSLADIPRGIAISR